MTVTAIATMVVRLIASKISRPAAECGVESSEQQLIVARFTETTIDGEVTKIISSFYFKVPQKI